MLRQIYCIALIVLIFLTGGCGEGILDPGDVATPLAGTYRLESRTFVAQDSAGTTVVSNARAALTLSRKGRYGQIDTVTTNTGVLIFTETGRWSVLNDSFFIESDNDRFATEQFTYDGERLTRIAVDQFTLDEFGNPSAPFTVIDVWFQTSRQ